MAQVTAVRGAGRSERRGLQRTVGFWGLTFVSLGSIIGSGWLLGALTAAGYAGGGGSLISWVLAAVMLIVLALIHADLGAAYPVAGGTSRYPAYAFGSFGGFTAGWTTYLQAVAVAPLEVEASLSYVNSVGSVRDTLPLVHTDGTLTGAGVVIGILAMALFAFINLGGARWLSDSNTGIVLWKLFVPVLTIVTLLLIDFHPGNFTANGGFAPFGFHGVFAALPAGVVFALQGFEQATQMAGESVNPRKHVSRAIILAMVIGAVVYIGLEVAFVGALNPQQLMTQGWSQPIGAGDYGPYYTLAIQSGVAWLAVVLIIDAVISPGGTGLVYVATTARISYALGLPDALTRTSKRGVPVWSVVVATVFGIIFLAPAPSWQQLVSLITGATAIMYAFAPVSLGALMKNDPDREHPYLVPFPRVLLPAGFAFANLIIYWGGFATTWKLALGLLLGQLIFALATRLRARNLAVGRARVLRFCAWMWPWQIGLVVLGLLGNYGDGALKVLPDEWDALVVVLFSLVVYFFAVRQVQPAEDIAPMVEEDLDDPDHALAAGPATA
jgi:amino acid transporter